MSQAWVLLWLANEPATVSQAQQVQNWADSKDVRLVAPAESSVNHAASRSSRLELGATAAHIEAQLERARLAANALDAPTASELLDQAEDALLVQAELPQAPWLLAEAWSLKADLAVVLGDAEQALQFRRAAARLEGGRSPVASSPSPDSDPHGDTDTSTWHVTGLRPGDHLLWNGVPPSRTDEPPSWVIEAEPGLHHARVVRGGNVIWSAWIDLRENAARTLDLPLPAPIPCSREDLAPMRRRGLSGLPVACDRWIAARPATPLTGSASNGASPAVEIAWCHRNQCGTFETWPRAAAPAQALTETAGDAVNEAPPWWSYALLGTVATATATLLILSVTQSRPAEQPVWVYGGIK